MSDQLRVISNREPAARPDWEVALDQLERSLWGALRALDQLRATLGQTAPGTAPPAAQATPVASTPAPGATAPPPQPGLEPASEPRETAYSPFERLWERMEHERLERQEGAGAGEPARRGLDLLPQVYLMTVEDREHRVDLVALHRALQGLPHLDEIALVSFANGVPVVSLRTQGELDLERLRAAVAAAMDRVCELIPQENTGRIFLRLVPRGEGGV